MSQYLVARIRAAENVEVLLRTEVVAARGEGHLEAITLADRVRARRGGQHELAVRLHRDVAAHRWLGDDIVRDARASWSPDRT